MSSSHFLPKWKIIQKHFALVHIVKIIRTEVGDVNTSETFSMSEPKPLPEQRECLLDVSDLFPIAVIKQADTSNLGWGWGDYHQSKLSSTRSKWQELEADCHSTTTPEQSVTSQRCYSANAGVQPHSTLRQPRLSKPRKWWCPNRSPFHIAQCHHSINPQVCLPQGPSPK